MNSSIPASPSGTPPTSGCKLVLLLVFVVLAILVAIAIAFAFPVFFRMKSGANKAVALNAMRQLGSAAGAYASQNDGALPAVDSRGTDTWAAAASRENANAWYNALPVILSQKSVAQYAANPQAFYSKENILFLPGAKYPDSDKKLARPFFAIAINTELQRMDKNGKKSVKLAQISNPARTVLFLEQGLPGEVKVSPIQPKYDGSPRGSAKSFVARYEGVGVVTFVDGHVEIIERKDMVEQAVLDKFAPKPGDVIWAETPAESPNK